MLPPSALFTVDSFPLIVEGVTDKVFHFKVPLKSVYTQNLCFNEQKCIFWLSTDTINVCNNNIIFVLKMVFLPYLCCHLYNYLCITLKCFFLCPLLKPVLKGDTSKFGHFLSIWRKKQLPTKFFLKLATLSARWRYRVAE